MRKPLFSSILFVLFLIWPSIGHCITSIEKSQLTDSLSQSIIALGDTHSGFAPSFYGYPGFESLTFSYDAAVMVMMLKAAGQQDQAEKALDYLVSKLNLSFDQVLKNCDSNKTYGILKIIGEGDEVGLLNGFDRTSTRLEGQGQMEYLVTPGPLAFVVMALLQVNPTKYRGPAIMLGETLLSMQREDGGITDGDRNAENVHTEPHMDTMSVFYDLFDLTQDQRWKIAGDRAAQWFMDNVLRSPDALVYQGMRKMGPSDVFATDAYSWTMAGRMGDMLSLDVLTAMTEQMLKKSLVKITVELPDGRMQTAVSIDFTDALDPEVIKSRQGFHPMGSSEWTSGVMLSLQKNAVRAHKAGNLPLAKRFKAMAEFMTDEWVKMSYVVDGHTMFSYATGQNVEVGHGWKTPYFYVKQGDEVKIKGGSLIGGWGVLPINGINPFILNDDYYSVYQQIDTQAHDLKRVKDEILLMASVRTYEEALLSNVPDEEMQIIEPGKFNELAWKAFERQDYPKAIFWASKVTGDAKWVKLAQEEQRKKAWEVGGLIDYQWGTTFAGNQSEAHAKIWKYPLLNEMGTAMWILSASNYELGNTIETKQWMKRIATEVPYHQIPNVVLNAQTGKKDLIDGYWNALSSWVNGSGISPRDIKMGELARTSGLNMATIYIVTTPALPSLSQN